MAIRIQHGPIGTAIALAGEAGRGVAAEREMAMRQQLAAEHANRLQQALQMRQLQQRDRMAAQDTALRQQQLAAEQKYRQQSLGLQARGMQQEQRQFEQQLPLQQLRAEAQYMHAARQGQPQQVTDPARLPAFRQAEAAKKVRQDRIRSLENARDRLVQEDIMGNRVPIKGKEAEVRRLNQQIAEIGGEMGKIAQEQQKLVDEFSVGQQVDNELAAVEQQRQQVAAEEDRVVRRIESRLSEDAATHEIIDEVVTEMGAPETREEAQELADMVNAIERRLRGR